MTLPGDAKHNDANTHGFHKSAFSGIIIYLFYKYFIFLKDYNIIYGKLVLILNMTSYYIPRYIPRHMLFI